MIFPIADVSDVFDWFGEVFSSLPGWLQFVLVCCFIFAIVNLTSAKRPKTGQPQQPQGNSGFGLPNMFGNRPANTAPTPPQQTAAPVAAPVQSAPPPAASTDTDDPFANL